MGRTMRVSQGAAGGEVRRPTAIESAYDHFRLERQGNLVSAGTLSHYDYLVGPFFDWLRAVHPEVVRFEDLGVAVVRQYRAELAARVGRHGRTLQPATLHDSHPA